MNYFNYLQQGGETTALIEGTPLPSTGDPEKDAEIKRQYELGQKDKPLEIVSPEFMLLTGLRMPNLLEPAAKKAYTNALLSKEMNMGTRRAVMKGSKFLQNPYVGKVINIINPFF